MKPIAVLSFLMLISPFLLAQSLHPLEPAKNHYKDLLSLSPAANPEKAALDQISFPSSLYGYALIYVMVAPEYLNEDQIGHIKNSLKFPANSSDQTQAELDFLFDWQNKRTESQIQRARDVLAPIGYWPHISLMKDHERYQVNWENLFYEGRTVLGPHCTVENYPATAKLLAGVTKDMRIMEFTVKFHLLRPRPYHIDSRIEPLANMSSPSFASGHTLWAYIQAFVWSELIPEKRQEFLDIAYEVGESREIMGIHYPSDEEAARILAHRMLSSMWENPQFKQDLDKAKAEWKIRKKK